MVSYAYVNKNTMVAWEFIQKWPFYFHLLFCYLLLGHVLGSLIRKTFSVSPIYKFQYYIIVIIIALETLANGIFLMLTDYITDLSTAVYGIGSIIIYYFTLKYVPSKLRKDFGIIVVDRFNESMIYYDKDGEMIYANNEAERRFFQHNINFSLKKFFVYIGFDQNKLDEKQTLTLINYDGSTNDYRVSYEKFMDKKGRLIGSIVTLDDITELIAKQNKVIYDNQHDKLTDLFNQETIFEYGEKLIRQNTDILYEVIVTNLVGFKLINEYLGKSVGDTLLASLAKVLKDNIIPGKVHAGRLENDRFLIIAPEKMHIENKLSKEMHKVGDKFKKDRNLNILIRINFGIYKVTEPYFEFSKFVDRASIALGLLYENSEDNIVFYDDEMRDKGIYEAQLIAEFPEALKHHEFVGYIQPQVDSVNHKIVGGELLVRWISKSRGIISPGFFIPLCEKVV